MTGRFSATHVPTVVARIAYALDWEWEQRMRRVAGLLEWRVLAALHDMPSEAVTGLARLCLVQQPTMTKVLNRMARKGIVRRRQSERDRRVVLVSLTDQGTELARALTEQARLFEGDVLGRFPGLGGPGLQETLALMERGGGA